MLARYGTTVLFIASTTVEAIIAALGAHVGLGASNMLRWALFRLQRGVFSTPRYLVDGAELEVQWHVNRDVQAALEAGLPISLRASVTAASRPWERRGVSADIVNQLMDWAKEFAKSAVDDVLGALDLGRIDAYVAKSAVDDALEESNAGVARAFECAERYGELPLVTYLKSDVAVAVAVLARLWARDKSEPELEASAEKRLNEIHRNLRTPLPLDGARMQMIVAGERAMRARLLPAPMSEHIGMWLGALGDTPPVYDIVSATRAAQMYCRVLCYVRNIADKMLKPAVQPWVADDIIARVMPYGTTVLAVVSCVVEATRAPTTECGASSYYAVYTQLQAYHSRFLSPQVAYADGWSTTYVVDHHSANEALQNAKRDVLDAGKGLDDANDAAQEASDLVSGMQTEVASHAVDAPETWGMLGGKSAVLAVLGRKPGPLSPPTAVLRPSRTTQS
jgi:hypothetical protein